ncbi:cytochrome P450 [Mycena olivaceomarginata]|nr:cytochrome P450 [Mycena olivaceomarginata]
MRRFYLMKRFYDIMTAAIEARRTEGRDDEDPMQYLIDEGLSSLEITQFTLAALFSGTANTGVVAAYFLCDLATHPAYLTLIRAELRAFVSQTGSGATALPPDQPLSQETLRLRIATPFHRLNDSGKDMEIAGTVVPHGTILTFHSSFMHHSEDFYVEPLVWDPERFSAERAEDKGRPMAFARWGLGKHQCLGQRVNCARGWNADG